MKKSIIKKIETLMSSIYGDTFPESHESLNNKQEDKQAGDDQRRCKNSPFEFIRLIL